MQHRSKTHKDVEFHVSIPHVGGESLVFSKFVEASSQAVIFAVGGSKVHLDVIIWSRAGAKWWLGEEGVRIYDEDPEASVFQRIVVRADDMGRVP